VIVPEGIESLKDGWLAVLYCYMLALPHRNILAANRQVYTLVSNGAVIGNPTLFMVE
jgi:hypothetical protein